MLSAKSRQSGFWTQNGHTVYSRTWFPFLSHIHQEEVPLGMASESEYVVAAFKRRKQVVRRLQESLLGVAVSSRMNWAVAGIVQDASHEDVWQSVMRIVGVWGPERQTSIVSRFNQDCKPPCVNPDLFLFTMRCRRVT